MVWLAARLIMGVVGAVVRAAVDVVGVGAFVEGAVVGVLGGRTALGPACRAVRLNISAHDGGGCEMVAMSGIICARDLRLSCCL